MDNAAYWFCESNNLFLVEKLYDNVNLKQARVKQHLYLAWH